MILCYSPMFIFTLVYANFPSRRLLKVWWILVYTVTFMNSSINPLLYCWRTYELRAAILKILQNILVKKTVENWSKLISKAGRRRRRKKRGGEGWEEEEEEEDKVKVFCGFSIQIDYYFVHYRPDIVVLEKHQEHTLLLMCHVSLLRGWNLLALSLFAHRWFLIDWGKKLNYVPT